MKNFSIKLLMLAVIVFFTSVSLNANAQKKGEPIRALKGDVLQLRDGSCCDLTPEEAADFHYAMDVLRLAKQSTTDLLEKVIIRNQMDYLKAHPTEALKWLDEWGYIDS
ncbi:hypothetical protein [Maribellus mangrovi]|uniref:hypothetical protein n=1 Tax=Maribellus mangrovi TaxID=3133146 RepID=UPI0030EDE67F